MTSPKALADARVGSLTALAVLLYAMARSRRSLHEGGVAALSSALLSPDVRACDAPAAQLQAAEAVGAAVRAAPEQARSVAGDLFLVLLHVTAPEARTAAEAASRGLAEACGHSDPEKLAAEHAPALFDRGEAGTPHPQPHPRAL